MSQHMDALAHANEIRLARAVIKAKLRSGEISVLDAFDAPCCARMTVYALLSSQWRWGPARVIKLFSGLNREGVHIGMSKQVCELTERQRQVLERALSPRRRERSA